MDEIRDWILIIGSTVFAALLAHAGWLAWPHRRAHRRIDIDLEAAPDAEDELELLRGELPSGGARVVSARDADHDVGQQADLDLDQQVPVLLEPVAEQGEVRSAKAAAEGVSSHSPEGAPVRSQADEWGDFDEVVVINVLARDGGFTGVDILDFVGRHGLKFGDMNIFHRYTPGKRSLDGIRFSLASAVEPGTFDIGVLEQTTTPGVSFFMRLPGPEKPMSAFEEMLRMSKDLAERLNGELRDEQRSVMTPQTIEHCRQRIHEFTRKRLMRRA